MINLLPQEIKEEILAEKNKKVFTIITITLLIPLVCLILILLSTLTYIFGQVELSKVAFEDSKKAYETKDFLTFTDIIKTNNKNLLQLTSFYKNPFYMSDALSILTTIDRPESIYFTNLSLVRTTGKMKATISGFSKSREDLLAFKKSIEETNRIATAAFSPESWIAAQNVKFNLTLELPYAQKK